MCVRGCDSSKKAERRVTWCGQVLRSPNLFKKTAHHRKLKMQSFLNVITLQTYTFFTTLTPRLYGHSKLFFRRPQNLNAPRKYQCFIVATCSGLTNHLQASFHRYEVHSLHIISFIHYCCVLTVTLKHSEVQEFRHVPCVPVIHSNPPLCLVLPGGLSLVLYSLLVCLLKDQDGLNLVSSSFSKSSLVTSEDRPRVPLLASCVLY